MIESALIQTAASPREDAGYKSWESSARKAVMRHDLNERTAGPMPSFGSMVHETALAAQGMHYAPHGSSSLANDAASPDIAYEDEKDDGFSFGDVIDIINPLQHLPVIGTLYRKITGDTMGSFSGIVGSTIFGGPLGAIGSGINLALKESTGKDLAENAMSLVGFDVTPAIKNLRSISKAPRNPPQRTMKIPWPLPIFTKRRQTAQKISPRRPPLIAGTLSRVPRTARCPPARM